MHKNKLKLFKFIIIFLILFIIPLIKPMSVVYASGNKNSTYYHNIDDSTLNDIFELKEGDIIHPFEWLKNRETYTVVEISKIDNSKIFWFNVPNLQTILYNETTQVLPTGYSGSGITPSYKDSNFRLISIPTASDAKTGLERYGFNIPSPTYLGETPRISMSIMGVIIESNPIKFIVSKVSGLFGGSVLDPPDTSAMQTLTYLTPNDYEPSNKTFEKWMDIYWDSTISSMKNNQVLIGDADKKTGKKNNIAYVKKTIITDTGLDKPMSSSVRNEKLKELLGPEYQEVVKNIVAYSKHGFNLVPERIMPYDLSSLTDLDKKELSLPDPRTVYQTSINILGIPIPISIDKIVMNTFNNFSLNFSGKISELTVFINSITNFTTIETIGLDPMILWKSPISQIIISIALIMLVFLLLREVIQIVKGEKGALQGIGRALASFFLIGLLIGVSAQPKVCYNAVKSFSSLFFNAGTQLISATPQSNILMQDGDSSEKASCVYWLPYFALWSDYNTGTTLDKNIIDSSKLNNEPEQQNMKFPIINNKNINLWSALLAQSFTSGPTINNSSYRVVDHFMAPKVSFDVNKSPMLNISQNKNYNGGIQRNIDFGVFLFILIIFLCVLIKLLLFLEALYELIMLQVHLALASIKPRDMKLTFLQFLVSFIRVGLWDMVTCMVIYMSMITTGIISILLAISVITISILSIKALLNSNSILVPRMIKSTMRFVENHK